MIRFTWLQFRAQAVAASAALAVIAVILAVTGPHLAHLYDTSGIPACHAHGDCGALASSFQIQLNAGSTYKLLYLFGTGVLFLLPAVTGIFWGAPLVSRELETGTHRLAWTQGVTRARWLAVKLGVVGLASMAAAGLLSLMLTWWSSPIEQAAGLTAGPASALSVNQFDPVIFGARGIVPIGYAAFAFALGVSAGVLTRRIVPAMAITLAIFAAVQTIMPFWIRPRLIPPVHTTVPLTAAALNVATSVLTHSNGTLTVGIVTLPGAWILSTSPAVNPAGHVLHNLGQACTAVKDRNACLARLNLRIPVTYQPASRYWAFQWYETAIFLAAALALAGFCFWWTRQRRLS